MPSCRDFTVLMSHELDRPLSWWQRFQLGAHTFLCGKCNRFRRHLRFLTEAVERYLTAEAEPPALRGLKLLPPDARARVERALRDASP